MTNTPELPDCAGCTDPRSEGTHAVGTKQHPGNTPERKECKHDWYTWREYLEEIGIPALSIGDEPTFAPQWCAMCGAIGFDGTWLTPADHAAATALEAVVKALRGTVDMLAEYEGNDSYWVTEGREALQHPAVVARLEGK